MKISIKGYWRIVVIALLAWQGCTFKNKEKDIVVQVDEEFKVGLNELLGATRQLSFELESVQNEDCLNSTIDLSILSQPLKITMSLNGIKTATDCTPGEAPARSNVNVGVVSNGVYDFLVVVGKTVENEGELIVDDSKYEINMFSTDGIIVTNKTMFRIPDKTIWGYVAYDDESLAGAASANFIADLENMVESHQLVQGYYGQFSINNVGGLVLKTPPALLHIKSFLYKYDGNDNELADLLKTHRNSAGGVMEMVLYTSEGKTL